MSKNPPARSDPTSFHGSSGLVFRKMRCTWSGKQLTHVLPNLPYRTMKGHHTQQRSDGEVIWPEMYRVGEFKAWTLHFRDQHTQSKKE